MKSKRGKCLALAAVLAMVVCAFAIAMPAGDSDAASTETVDLSDKTVVVLTNDYKMEDASKIYIVKESLKAFATVAATVYVLKGATLTINSSFDFKMIPADSVADDNKSLVKYTGIELTNVNNVTSYAVAEDGKVTATGTDVPTGTYGIGVKDSNGAAYYPEGKSFAEAVVLKESGDSITIKNGSAVVKAQNGSASSSDDPQLTAEDLVSTDGVAISTTGSGSMSVAGTIKSGTLTMDSGSASGDASGIAPSGNANEDGSPCLNAYAESTTNITAAPTSSTTAVYGKVSGGTASDSVALYNATVSKLALGTAGVISAEGYEGTKGATATVDADSNLKLVSGALRLVSGEFIADGDANMLTFSMGDKTRLDIGAGATLTFTIGGTKYLGNDSVMNVYGKITTSDLDGATVTITDPENGTATFNAYSGATIGEKIVITTSKGTTDGAMKEVTINDDWSSSVTFSQFQAVRVTNNITITQDIVVNVLGKLTIDDGASIAIKNGAKLYIGGIDGVPQAVNKSAEVEILGDLEIEAGGLFDVLGGKSTKIYGNVEVSGNSKTDGSEGFVVADSAAPTVLMAGAVMTVDDKANLAAGAGLTISAGAKVVVEGNFSGTKVSNAGSLVLDGATVDTKSADVTISMAGDGAVVEIREATLSKGDHGIVITDEGLTFANGEKVSKYANKVAAKAYVTDDGYGIEGLTVTEFVISNSHGGTTDYYNFMDLSGNVEGYKKDGTIAEKNDGISLTVTGSYNEAALMTVWTSLTVGEGVNFINRGSLAVYGELTHVADKSSIGNGGTIEVYGTVQALKGDDLEGLGTIIAAMYTVAEDGKTYKIYTTLPIAVESGATSITVMGNMTMYEDLTIPEGVTIKANTTGTEITIGSADDRTVTLTVEEGAVLKDGKYTVLGTLYFCSEKKSNKTSSIESEVRTSDGEFAKYTNVYTALSEAVSGETVKVTGDVHLTQDITIAEGVILQIPAGIYMNVDSGVTVNVVGTLDAWEKIVSAADFNPENEDHSTIKVTGVFQSGDKLDYSYYFIPGAYFTIVDSAATYNYVAPVDTAAAMADLVKDGAIGIYGDVSCGDVGFEGTATKEVVVTIHGALTAGTISLSYAQITTCKDDVAPSFTGSVGSDAGKVSFANAKGFFVQEFKDSDVSVLKLWGTLAKAAEGKSFSAKIASGTVAVTGKNYNLVADFMIVDEGATLLVTDNAVASFTTLTVNGEADTANAGKIAADVLGVLGTVTVGSADPFKSVQAGALYAPFIYVGVSESADAAAAALNVPEGVDIGVDLIYVAAGSSVSANVTEDMASTVYNVEGTQYLTAYMASGGSDRIAGLAYPTLAGKVVTGWSFMRDGTCMIADREVIGDVASVDAVIDVFVYKVAIVADYGFADIFIDGAKVASIASGIIQYIDETAQKNGYLSLAAGSHAVDWKLKNNYNGDNVTTSFNGSQFSGSFSISIDMEFQSVYKLALTGAAEQPQIPDDQPSDSKDEGLGITDYLHIVLVILIAVMAVMAILRLNRS